MLNKLPFQVGLTGGIGSGKSVVGKIFKALGVPVYESDDAAKALYFQPHIRLAVEALLGKEVYLPDGKPDTKKIAGLIYANAEWREGLNHILHPAVALHYQKWLAAQKSPYVVKIAALLVEAHLTSNFNLVLLVKAPEDIKLERIALRDPQRGKTEIQRIMASQLSDDAKMEFAQGIILNDEEHSLVEQVITWHQNILKQCG